jgi:hypothetical protein
MNGPSTSVSLALMRVGTKDVACARAPVSTDRDLTGMFNGPAMPGSSSAVRYRGQRDDWPTRSLAQRGHTTQGLTEARATGRWLSRVYRPGVMECRDDQRPR